MKKNPIPDTFENLKSRFESKIFIYRTITVVQDLNPEARFHSTLYKRKKSIYQISSNDPIDAVNAHKILNSFARMEKIDMIISLMYAFLIISILSANIFFFYKDWEIAKEHWKVAVTIFIVGFLTSTMIFFILLKNYIFKKIEHVIFEFQTK